MMIREPLVHATYYYLREDPGDSAARRQDRHETFAADARRMAQILAGWLAIPVPELPAIPAWESDSPRDVQPLMPVRALEGRTNASALLGAYALRNTLLLRVMVMRRGEYEQAVWPMLEEVLGEWPTTPTWLHTSRYWCGVAPRPPEDLEQERSLPVKTPCGVLCLGHEALAHLLIYPDARTEARANTFLESLAARLDWYAVQARYDLDHYSDRASSMARNQQQTLEQISHLAQEWMTSTRRPPLSLAEPLHSELDSLEITYREVLADLDTSQKAMHAVRTLKNEYRLTLKQSGLWDIAPTVWEAQAAGMAEVETQIEADIHAIDNTLRRIDTTIHLRQTRLALLQSERERLLIYLIVLFGIAVLAVLIADTSPARVVARLLALALAAGAAWGGWQYWLKKHPPER